MIKVSLQRTTKKFLRFDHPTTKKFLCFYHATVKKSLRFLGLQLNSQSAARRTSSCKRKRRFLRVHYFWAVLYLQMLASYLFDLHWFRQRVIIFQSGHCSLFLTAFSTCNIPSGKIPMVKYIIGLYTVYMYTKFKG